MKQWQVLHTLEERKSAEEIIEILLKSRGLKSKKEIATFLNPPHPKTLSDRSLGISAQNLKKAVGRIKKAIAAGELIIIFGDYDADGICATAVLWEALDQQGACCLPYIPQRLVQGYGLSREGIDHLLAANPKTKLIVTVDNGITASKAAAYARKKGIEVIITDHHLKPEKLPPALAIIHTTKLAGVGVAWVLARKLAEKIDLSLLAIGTIADMVPLTGANRSLVKFGLKRLNRTRRLGLLALFKQAGLVEGKIEAWQVSFLISPRLNASGRLTDAMDSLRLLCTRDARRAESLAQKINQENRQRQRLTETALLDAKNLLVKPCLKLLFVVSPSYHEGIVGLVAGDLVKEFYRPAIVISQGKEFSRGSARSINGFNIIQAIRQCGSLLIDCGGHPLAAGLTVKTSNLKKLEKKLTSIVARALGEKQLTPALKIDLEIKLSQITWKLQEMLEKFSPFGVGHPQPVFCCRGLRVVGLRAVGNNGHHLKMKLDDPQTQTREAFPAFEEAPVFDGIGFGLGNLAPTLKKGTLVDIAYTIEKNVWNNEERLELKIKDIIKVV